MDFDNDGFRDIIVTNGFPKDVTDHDFIAFRNHAYAIATKQQLLEQIPEVKLHNYAFQNNGNLTFSNASNEWGLNMPTFSNGAVYADLDNDGAMDLIINNINDEAFIYKNNARKNNKENSHYLQIQCLGDDQNINGLGAWIEIYYDEDKQQVYENTPYRGYLSSVQNIAHFGLGKVQIVDSIVIKWPNGKKQILQNIKADQLLKLNQKDAQINYSFSKDVFAKNTLFKEITDSVGIHYFHQEKDFIDFNIQKLLPHKFSQYSPAIAAGDIDGNGLDDLIVGGSSLFPAQLFLQQTDGSFIQKSLYEKTVDETKFKDAGLLLFDADGDGDLDLYIASGGYEYEPNTAPYQDRLYVNDGKGNFILDTSALPKNFTSKSCVRAIDFDNDGDLDLFVSGRVEPWNYPKPVSSFIFRNDSKNGQIKFTDVTNEVAKDLTKIGLVCDALFTDFDNDGWPDLILAGEWMPVTFLKNDKGVFKNITASTGISKYTGWWNSIVAGDFDNDGDMDYIVGNLGENSFYKASDKYPVCITAKDFDNNGIYDAFPSLFLPVSQQDTHQKEFPAQTRDDVLKQVLSLRARFPSYKSFATAGMDEVLSAEQRKGALRLEANYMKSVYLRNDGNGKFSISPLPVQAQVSVLNGMVVDDFDADGNLDVIINGNDYGTEVSVGRYDALNGLMLKGDGKGNFIAQTILESGIYIPGDGKALVKLRSNNGKYLLAASQNRGVLKLMELKKNTGIINLQPFDVSATVNYQNGKRQKREVYYGSSFLSQSARFLNLDQNVTSIEITDNKGNKRNQTVKRE